MNAEFQRTARRYKQAFLSGQCKEIEEENRMEKTRDLFKKIRDTEGTFHVKMGTMKDRNGMDLTQAGEKAMATHSSVLAWRIPGTGELGGLLSMGTQSRTQLKQLSSSSSSSDSAVNNPPANAGNADLIPGLGRSPGGGHDNPPQNSCLEKPQGQRSLAS